MVFVKLNGVINITVSQTVSVSEEEVVILHVRQRARKTTTGLGVRAGIEQRHRPIFLIVMGMILYLGFATELKRHVAGLPKVVAKKILDDLTLVTETEDELLMPVMGVGLHNVPKNRPAPDGHHRFGTILRLLTKPGTFPAA